MVEFASVQCTLTHTPGAYSHWTQGTWKRLQMIEYRIMEGQNHSG